LQSKKRQKGGKRRETGKKTCAVYLHIQKRQRIINRFREMAQKNRRVNLKEKLERVHE
jgi:hypothetical protein